MIALHNEIATNVVLREDALWLGTLYLGVVSHPACLAGVDMTVMHSEWKRLQCGTAGMLAPEGRCRTLDAAANGYVRAEAVGGARLRLLSLVAGMELGGAAPRPHALLHGAALNQDGRSSSLTAPSGRAQQALLRSVLATANMAPSMVLRALHCQPDHPLFFSNDLAAADLSTAKEAKCTLLHDTRRYLRRHARPVAVHSVQPARALS